MINKKSCNMVRFISSHMNHSSDKLQISMDMAKARNGQILADLNNCGSHLDRHMDNTGRKTLANKLTLQDGHEKLISSKECGASIAAIL